MTTNGALPRRWTYGPNHPTILRIVVPDTMVREAGGVFVRLRTPLGTTSVRVIVRFGDRPAQGASVALEKGWNNLRIPWSAMLPAHGTFEGDPAPQPGTLVLLVEPEARPRITWLEISDQRVLIPMTPDPPYPEPNRILLNQVGWQETALKRFLVAGIQDDSFRLFNEQGTETLRGPLVIRDRRAVAGTVFREGRIDQFLESGKWILKIGSEVCTVQVTKSPLRQPMLLAMRAFYLWRSGIDLPEHFAGHWHREAGHPDTALYLLNAPPASRTSLDVRGGWYDAGDYGKYVVNGAATVANLLLLADLVPGAFPDGSLGIPESGNGVPDLLDEVRWQMDWLLRMQDLDGGVFFKVAGLRWPGGMLPSQDTTRRWVIGKSTSSTLDFAAVAAMAARVWRSLDPGFSRRCLLAAERAMDWADHHPRVLYPSEGRGSGLYPDLNLDDEFFWAEAELWRTTKKAHWKTRFSRRMDSLPLSEAAGWKDVRNFGWYALALDGGRDPLVVRAREAISSMASSHRVTAARSALGIPLEHFRAGSNGSLASRGVLVAVHYRLARQGEDLDVAQNCLDYLLGRNPVGTSYLTGVGRDSPRDPHMRIAWGDAVELPPPGFLVGGPNEVRRDDQIRRPNGTVYPRTEPARAWADNRKSYSTNEVAINWNAPLVVLMAVVDAANVSAKRTLPGMKATRSSH